MGVDTADNCSLNMLLHLRHLQQNAICIDLVRWLTKRLLPSWGRDRGTVFMYDKLVMLVIIGRPLLKGGTAPNSQQPYG